MSTALGLDYLPVPLQASVIRLQPVRFQASWNDGLLCSDMGRLAYPPFSFAKKGLIRPLIFSGKCFIFQRIKTHRSHDPV
jgi:hypothetical protein